MKLVGPLQEPKFPTCMYHFGTPHLLKIPNLWSMPPQWRKTPLRTPLNQNFSFWKLPRWQSLSPKKEDNPTLLTRIWPKKGIIPFLDKLLLSFGRISISNFLIWNPSATAKTWAQTPRPRSDVLVAATLFLLRIILFDAQSTVGNGQDITFPAGDEGCTG